MQKVKDFFGQIARIVILSAFAASTFSMVIAWTGPSTGAPGGNVVGPINISATAQTKAGSITASDFCTAAGKCLSGVVSSFGGGYESGYVNIANPVTGALNCPSGTIARHVYTMDTNSTYSGGNGWLCIN